MKNECSHRRASSSLVGNRCALPVNKPAYATRSTVGGFVPALQLLPGRACALGHGHPHIESHVHAKRDALMAAVVMQCAPAGWGFARGVRLTSLAVPALVGTVIAAGPHMGCGYGLRGHVSAGRQQ
jgi:hypothetical protein